MNFTFGSKNPTYLKKALVEKYSLDSAETPTPENQQRILKHVLNAKKGEGGDGEELPDDVECGVCGSQDLDEDELMSGRRKRSVREFMEDTER